MSNETVYLVDVVATKPGQAKTFLDAYMKGYVPGARTRGMKLERVLVTPPVWLEEESNTVIITWTLQGAAGFWGMTFQGRQDPALRDWWWHQASDLIQSRRRYVAGELSSVDELSKV